MRHQTLVALVVGALSAVRGLFAVASGDLDHGGGGAVLVLLAVAILLGAVLLRDDLGTGVRVLVIVAALGCALAAWGEIGHARATTSAEVRESQDRVDVGGAVTGAGVAAAAVAALVGRRVRPVAGLVAVGLSVAVPPFVLPALGLPVLLAGLRQPGA